MRLGEIGDVHVVAYAGPVRGRPVLPEDDELRPPAERRVDHQRHEMRLGLVVLAERAFGIGAGRVEIAQPRAAQPVHAIGPVERALDHVLALAIGRGWLDGIVLADRRVARRAIEVGGAAQHEARDAVAQAGIDQRDAVIGVLDEIPKRVLHALAHQRARGEMQHGVPGLRGQDAVERRDVADRGDVERHAGRHRCTMALAQIVDHRDVDAARPQRAHHMAANEAGAAGHQAATQRGQRPWRRAAGRIAHQVGPAAAGACASPVLPPATGTVSLMRRKVAKACATTWSML